MRKLFLIALALLFLPFCIQTQTASASSFQNKETGSTEGRRHSRRHRRRHERRRRGIGQTYKEAGTSTAQGGTDFGKNIARGKPIVAGRRLGKGVGRGGKRVGQGTAGVGRKVGDTTKDVVKPKPSPQ